MTRNEPYTIVVEGNVGSGKSTLLGLLSELPGVMTVLEPVDQWQNVNGTDLLEMMYDDGNRWTGLFQMESTLSRMKSAVQEPLDKHGNRAKVRVMERSLYSERACFLEYLKKAGKISPPEYSVMDLWFKFAVEHIEDKIKPDLIGNRAIPHLNNFQIGHGVPFWLLQMSIYHLEVVLRT